MSASNSLHYQLCVEGGKWLHRRKRDYKKCDGRECQYKFCRFCHQYHYVAIEMNTWNMEQCDVWGYDGCDTVVIEVKTSHSDFVADLKKECRKKENEIYQCGKIRWYLCPEGVIKAEELPKGWGLLYWDGKRIYYVVAPEEFPNTWYADMRMLYSIVLREKLPRKIYNYRGTNTTIKPKAVLDVDEMKPLDSDISEIVSEHLFDMV